MNESELIVKPGNIVVKPEDLEAKMMTSSVDKYYEKLTNILEADLNNSKTRMKLAWFFLAILVGLLIAIMIQSSCFVDAYLESQNGKTPIPEKFAIAYISINAVKIATIVGAAAAFVFRGFPHQKLPESKP